MSCNIGKVDRMIRIVVGIALLLIAVFYAQPWAYIGIIPLLTGIIKFCPVYGLLKLNTGCATDDKR